MARTSEIMGAELVPLPGTVTVADMPARDIEAVDRRLHFTEKLHEYVRAGG